MNLKRVEIITPVHNRREVTLQCLRSIARCDHTGLDLHVIIVDDGSTDGTAEAVELQFPDVEIIKGDGNLWYTAGTNRGIAAAMKHDPDYVLAINDDTIFDEKCIVRLVACAENNPRSVVGALLLNWETPHRVMQVSPRWEFWRGGYRHWYKQTVWTVPKEPWEVELIVGNCVLYPADAIREVGLMDEKRLPQYGDAEYTPRMRRRGWRLLIEPQARAFCEPNIAPSGFRHLPIKKQFEELFFKPMGHYSVQRRLYSNLAGAPNRLLALLAFPVTLMWLLLGKNPEGRSALADPEPPLSKVFGSHRHDQEYS